MKEPKVVIAEGIAPLGSEFKQAQGFPVILCQSAATSRVKIAESGLRGGVT